MQNLKCLNFRLWWRPISFERAFRRKAQMERIDIQIKLLEWRASDWRLEFVKNFDRVASDTLSLQVGMNHRTSAMHSSFVSLLSDLALNAQTLNGRMTELQKECISMTGQTLGIQNDKIADPDSLERGIADEIQRIEKLKSESSEKLKRLQLREQCVREQLAHLVEQREIQKNRLKGELDSSYHSALQSLRRLRSEFEEIYTCEEVATSLAIETERRIAEKSHSACEKMFQSAKNRIRRMETVRRKRLADIRKSLEELRKRVKMSRTPSSDDDTSDDLPSMPCAIDDTPESHQTHHGLSRSSNSRALLQESPPKDSRSESENEVDIICAHIEHPSESPTQLTATRDTEMDAGDQRASCPSSGMPSPDR